MYAFFITYFAIRLTLSDPGYFKQLTIRGGEKALKDQKHMRSRKP